MRRRKVSASGLGTAPPSFDGEARQPLFDLRNLGLELAQDVEQLLVALRFVIGLGQRLQRIVEHAGIGQYLVPTLLHGDDQPGAEQGLVELRVPIAQGQGMGRQPIAGERLVVGLA